MLRGASAEAQAGLLDDLPGSLTLDETASLGSELFAVADLLRAEPALRRIATDNSIPAEAKAELADRVLGDKLGDRAHAVVKDAVQRRWTTSADLGAALEHLGVVCTVRSAGARGADVSDELFAVAQLVDRNPDLRDALADPSRSLADRRGLMRDILGSDLKPATLRLVEQALAGHHGPFGVAIAALQETAAQVQGEVVATVHTARPLSADVRQRLTDALSKQYGAGVHLDEVLDPGLIGGMRIEIGDDVIDGTVSGRLDDARRKLAG